MTKDASGDVIGMALNFDVFDEPEPEIHGNLEQIFIFLEEVESPVKWVLLYLMQCWREIY